MFARPDSNLVTLHKTEGHQPAATSVFSEQAGGTIKKRASRDFCSCRHCRRARRTERMEPLSLRDRVWIYGVLAVGLGCYAALAWWAMQ